MVMNQYGFRPPLPQAVPTKRCRRTYEKTDDTHVVFGYACFQCNAPMDIESHTDTEIECSKCGSRIMRKNDSEKTRTVKAI